MPNISNPSETSSNTLFFHHISNLAYSLPHSWEEKNHLQCRLGSAREGNKSLIFTGQRKMGCWEGKRVFFFFMVAQWQENGCNFPDNLHTSRFGLPKPQQSPKASRCYRHTPLGNICHKEQPQLGQRRVGRQTVPV